MKNITPFFIFLLFICVIEISAQTKTITGVVTSEFDNTPLPGVSILLKGTTLGTVTNLSGEFSIKIPEDGKIIIFSFVGMKTEEIVIGNQTTINVSLMEDVFGLDEVVVAGIAGATEKKKLSVSVVSVSADDIEKVPAGSAASALQGKVAGVQVTSLGKPGAGATIQLRGATNFYGSQAPLIIMDGVFVEGSLADINIDDIASLEIVKGASASSLYGSRAGNGVIVITSKRGNTGNPEVTIRSEVGFQKIGRFMDVNLSHPYELASDWESYKGNYTRYDGVTYGPDYASVFAAGGDGPNVVEGSRILSEDGYADNPFGVYNNFQDLLFKEGFNATQYVSVAGGTEKFKTFFSSEYNKVDGVFREAEGYTRNSFRFNADYYITDWLKFSASNAFIKLINSGSIGDFRKITRISPDANVLYPNPDGQPYYFKPDPWDAEITNPLYQADNLDTREKQQRFLGGYKLNFKFTNFLNLDAEYSFESNTNLHTGNQKYETYTGGTGDPIGFGYSKGSLSKNSSLNMVQKAQTTLNFVKQFDELDVKAKLSYLAEDRHYEYYSAYGFNYIYKGIASLDNFKPENTYVDSEQTAERAQNLFAIVGLIYKDRYIFDGLYRKDGSSLFGENERWNNYYRVSAAYRITKDIQIPGIQEMKINVAKGTAGQRPGFTWQYEMTELSMGNLSSDRIAGNPDLRPSKTDETEIGLNIQFLERFSLDAAYSMQKSSDQFMLVNLFSPANAGKSKQWQNVGNLETNTLEISLKSQLVGLKDFNWDLTMNFTKSQSEITELNVPQQSLGGPFLIKEGIEFGSMWGNKFVSNLATMENQLAEGENIADYSVNSDGLVVKTEDIGTVNEIAFVELDEEGSPLVQQIGNQEANFFMNFISSMSYNNFDFYMLWDYKNGGDIYNHNVQWNTGFGQSAIVDQAGKPEDEKKTVQYYKSLYNGLRSTDFWVEDGSYLKLREISLSYTLRENQLHHFLNGFFKEFKFSAIGRNVLTFTDYSGWDPEVAAFQPIVQQYFSIDWGVYPTSSSYSFTVQLKF